MKVILKYIALLYVSMSIFSCTIGVISSDVSVSGRPIIFKTRDLYLRPDVQFNTYTPSEGYAYCANTYATNSTAWFGINEAGFGITQSDITNYAAHTNSDNGTIITLALSYFATVDDFEAYLDSTSFDPRSVCANYAIIDAEGNAAIFEVNNYGHYRYDPDENGFLTRANYGLEGSDTTNTYGLDRMNKADSLIQLAIDGDSLDAAYIAMQVMSNFSTPSQNPYPLPFDGSIDDLDTGWIDTDQNLTNARGIFSNQTICSGVIESCVPHGDPRTSVMYAGMDTPAISVPFVMFPAAHTPPPYVSGGSPAYLNLADENHDAAFHEYTHPDYLDTHMLMDSDGNGFWSYVRPATQWVFNTTDSFIDAVSTFELSETELMEFQDGIIDVVYSVMLSETFTLSIVENDSYITQIEKLSVYPNPFQDFVAIKQLEDCEIQIYDIKGNQIESGINNNKNCGIIWRPSNDIAEGVYLAVGFTKDGKKQSARFVYFK